jgi:sulfate transport system permease protein
MNSVTIAADKDLQWKDSLTTESPLVRRLLIAAAFLYLTLFLFVPLVAIFTEALKNGLSSYIDSFLNEDALAAIRLTLLVAAVLFR